MNPHVQKNRKSREMIYDQAMVANERESKKLTLELNRLESQQQRELFKLPKINFHMKSALSVPCLRTARLDISPRAPISLPASPVSSPLTKRRHSDIIPSPRARQFKDQSVVKQKDERNSLNRAKSEEEIDSRGRKMEKSNPNGEMSTRFSRSSAGHTHPRTACQEAFISSAKVGWSSRKLSTGSPHPLRSIHEYRDDLDQRIKKFHESLKALKGEANHDVFEENEPHDHEDVRDVHDNVPKLPEITTNAKRSQSLPSLIPRLSLVNLNCESSSSDDFHDGIQRCRYLRVSDQDALRVDEVFAKQRGKR